jgi:hypothetical protein
MAEPIRIKDPRLISTPVVTPLDVGIDTKRQVRNTNQRSIQGTEEDKKAFKRKPTQDWMKKLYDPSLIDNEELMDIYETIKYHGFDRDIILSKLEAVADDPKLVAEIIITCALRGPRQAALIKLRNGRTIQQLGIPASDQQGTENISCARIAAATADLAAFYMKRLDVPKRLVTIDLPGWLQFPTAGSIKLPNDLREKHITFAKQFSLQIGGAFNEQIYSTQMNNAYLDPNLKLFDN